MATFRLLHVSDLHIALKPERVGLSDLRKAGLRFPRDLPRVARASSYSPDLLDGLVEHVYGQGGRLDAVLLSGDLATTGKAEDLGQALSCVDGDDDGLWYNSPHAGRPAVSSHRALQGAARPILLLPGNHDRFGGPLYRPGGTLFDTYFGHYWDVGQGVKAWISPPKGGTRLGLVGADLSLRKGYRGKDWGDSYGQGYAYANMLAELQTLTEDLRAEYPGLGLLWVVHFPPAYPGIDPTLQLVKGEDLIDAAYAKRITHILAGHTHSPRAYRAVSGAGFPVEVLCAGTAAQGVAPEGNFIHELEITVKPGGTTSGSYRSFQWEEMGQQWVSVPSPSQTW